MMTTDNPDRVSKPGDADDAAWNDLKNGVVAADDEGPGFNWFNIKPRKDEAREAELDSFDAMMRNNRGVG